ncbi:hypothetical protein CCHR01_12556 [Colletotrichum chrysophilum]|uniref:Uncharacterized protein n=1 Tax=Colletotrichum chrysophilum TaxID=1836956 RepID=A0AAD9EDR0_9PEZI|nr:hypothetical protein CCHR01_12556 [Colletotrichum chrysophilum]
MGILSFRGGMNHLAVVAPWAPPTSQATWGPEREAERYFIRGLWRSGLSPSVRVQPVAPRLPYGVSNDQDDIRRKASTRSTAKSYGDAASVTARCPLPVARRYY